MNALLLSSVLAVVLVAVAASAYDFTTESPAQASAKVCEALLILVVMVFFWHVTLSLAAPVAAAIKAKGEARLEKALATEPAACSKAGITHAWYDAAGKASGKVASILATTAFMITAAAAKLALPQTLAEMLACGLQGGWERLLDSGLSSTAIVSLIIFGGFFATFWLVCIPFIACDLARPAALLPLKVQRDYVLTWSNLLQIVLVALVNQGLVLLTLVALNAYVLPTAAPHLLDRQLPGLLSVVLQLLGCLPLAELVFYSTHRLLHTQWLWTHVHYLHHKWSAPIAPCAVFAHPAEFLLANIPVIMMGPLLMGSHLAVWGVWAILATADTCIAHSGWHLPFLPSPESHDYHHSSGFLDNLGVIGVLDAYFNTDTHFRASAEAKHDKLYTNGDYAVDKLLDSGAPLEVAL